MDMKSTLSNEGGSYYRCYSGSDSDSDSDEFYCGYSEGPVRRPNTYISLPRLKNEYNVDMEKEKKILLFFYAVEEQDIAFMERLLLDDVGVDCVGRDGWTALMKACLNGQHRAVEFLLDHGGNPNYHADFYTSLMAGCTRNSAPEESKLACVNLLLEYNIDINAKDKHKTTALMHASSAGYLTIVDRLFLREDLIADAQDSEGWNAIFHAVSNNRIPIVEALINYGVNYKARDSYGRTPLILAEEKNLKKLIAFLMDLEEKTDSEDGESEEEGRAQNPHAYFLRELPNADGEGGFTSDTKDILSSNGFKKIKKIPFPDFLNMSDKDLLEAGIKINSQRKHILSKVIHRYHRCPWLKSSINSIKLGTNMRLEEGVCILGSVAKHLTLVKASLRYFKTRIQNRERKADTTLQKDTIDALISIFTSNRLMQEKLKNILELGNTVNLTEHADRIVVNREKESNKVKTTLKYGLMILGATTAGYYAFNFTLKIGSFINKFMFIRK